MNEDYIYYLFNETYKKHYYPVDDVDVIHVYEAVQCLLKSYYTRKHKRNLYNEKVVVLTIGEAIHKILQETMNGWGWETEKEVYYDAGRFRLVGHIDAFYNSTVVELKSVSVLPKQPLLEHRLQTNAYIKMSNATVGYIAYINKRNGKVRVFPVGFNLQDWVAVLNRAEFLHDCLRNGKKPPIGEFGWLCKYCEYVDVCKPPVKVLRSRRV